MGLLYHLAASNNYFGLLSFGFKCSVFRNEWVWNVFRWGITIFVTRARRVQCFVMNGCGIFSDEGLLFL